MIRKLAILFILITKTGYSQSTLEGKYCSVPIGESDVTCVNFLENNRFKYNVTGCLGVSSIGEGRYELKRSSLKLIFDKKEQLINSKVDIRSKPSMSDKEVKFEFNIKDQYGGPIFVFATDKTNGKDIGIDYEENKLILPKSDEKVIYEIHSVGYPSVELELDKNSDKVIDIILYEGQPQVISESTVKWNLTEMKSNEFKIGKEYWNTFRKVKQ
ncbi:hypothetical protein OZ410_09235 [Robiginitalea sp. M366]|uniref:hypothetical protein n=1 Tax=Robiginitalea aestuariiviva TaxID=3036903 RepID=UPI00240D5DA4|nr:hypothetical protein [Robiginitalea aestuariiviva]MDG1572498.1 hypothetical protein [Robiginitalea aestuariiviva]